MEISQEFAGAVRRLLQVNRGIVTRGSSAIRPGEYSVQRGVLWVSNRDQPVVDALIRDLRDRS